MMICLFLRDRYFHGAIGTGIPQVIASLDLKPDDPLRKKMLSGRILIGKTLLLILAILGGITVGREGPSVHIGACIIVLLTSRFVFSSPLMARGLIIGGGAAGIAAAFNAPIAGNSFWI